MAQPKTIPKTLIAEDMEQASMAMHRIKKKLLEAKRQFVRFISHEVVRMA